MDGTFRAPILVYSKFHGIRLRTRYETIVPVDFDPASSQMAEYSEIGLPEPAEDDPAQVRALIKKVAETS